MRNYEEYITTTNNSVYNKVCISYFSACGFCGLGTRCNKRHKGSRKQYGKWRRYKREWVDNCNCIRGEEFEYVGRYPNWKLVSKNSKQWMEKPIREIHEKHSLPWYNELHPDDVDYKWYWD